MNMKYISLPILTAVLLSPAYAQEAETVARKPGISVDENETSAWMRQTFEKRQAENKQRGHRRLTQDELLELVSLKDYNASVQEKNRIVSGIQLRSAGPLQVEEGPLPSASEIATGFRTRIRSGTELKEKLSYVPADLSRSPVGPAELLRIEPTGTISNGKSTGLIRTYLLPGSGVLVVSEDDYVASQTRITLIRETLNANVNGIPARAYSAMSKDGRGKAELRWVTPNRSYWLTFITDDSTQLQSGEMLLRQVAQSISM